MLNRRAKTPGNAAVAASLIVAPLAFGQAATESAADGSAVPLAEVVVTGSHIRGGEKPVVNVQTLDRAQLEETGASQISDIIRSIPSNTGTTLYNETGQLTGTAQISLRGLGFSSTLTLLNGRRAGVTPLSDKSGADFVDINQFPLSMVQRVDVLKDGASAIYGSEAVAGVVNLVTRKGFEGFEVGVNVESSRNDAWSFNLASGRKFDGGSMNFYATYYSQTGNVRSDFPWLVERVGGNGIPGRSQLINATGFPTTYQRATTNASGQVATFAGAVRAADPDCEEAGGVFPMNNANVPDTTQCYFNFIDQIGVIPDQQRVQAFFESDFRLTEPLTYFNEVSVSRNANRTFQQVGSFSNGSAVGNLIAVPANHPFNFFKADPADPRRIIAVDPALWNPAVDQAVPVVANIRPQGSYLQDDKRQTNTYIRAVNGLDLTLGSDWSATLAHQYAHAQFEENNPLIVNATSFNNLLATGRYNPFGTSVVNPTLVSPKDGVSIAANSEEVLDQVFYTSNATRRTEQQVVDLSASGEAIELPTGAVSAAVGSQYRTLSLNSTPDPISSAGLGNTTVREPSFRDTQNVWAAYAEAVFPIYERARLQLAIRHEDYGSDVGSTTDPKISGRLNFLSGALALRGSWGTSFQAPTLTQNSTQTVFAFVTNPVRVTPTGFTCGALGSGPIGGAIFVTQGGNLKPQSSENYNFGVDVQPLSSLLLTADLWHYDYTDLIAAGQNAQAIVNGECVNGVYTPDPRIRRDALGSINQITSAYTNVGKVIAEGVDVSASYASPLGSLGDLLLRADATYVNSFDLTGANGVTTNRVGSRNFTNNFAPMPRVRGSAHASWSRGIHEAALGVNYTDGYRNDQSNNGPVGSFTTVDLRYAVHLEKLFGTANAIQLSIGANNLLDRDPPALRRADVNGVALSGTLTDYERPGYDALAGADIRGRVYYARALYEF
jgi:iron complex outermembrane receptor protein